MNEKTWLTCTDPQKMLNSLWGRSGVSDRKLRLAACACARDVWSRLRSPACRRAVEIAERFADGVASLEDFDRANGAADRAITRLQRILRQWSARKRRLEIAPNRVAWATAFVSAPWASRIALDTHAQLGRKGRTLPWQCALLREIFGNPFRPCPALAPAWLAWNEGVVGRLAQAAYDERDPERGTLDGACLGVLADALEEAGCTEADLLGHLRGPGPHPRGCWGVDRILGRD